MFKVFLFVIVGTIAGWFAVDHLINATNDMPAGFTINSAEYLRNQAAHEAFLAQKEANSAEENYVAETFTKSVELENTAQPASVAANQRRRELAPRRSDQDEQGLRIESGEIESEEADEDATEALESIAELPTDETEEDDEELLADAEAILAATEGQEAPKDDRADSDADLQERGAKQGDESDEAQAPSDEIANARPSTQPVKKAEAVEALNVAYALPDGSECAMPTESYPQVGVLYRPTSFAIKGQSLSNIDQLIRLHRKCNGGTFVVIPKTTNEQDVDERLNQLRQDEVKYYLLQRRIPKEDIIFSDKS